MTYCMVTGIRQVNAGKVTYTSTNLGLGPSGNPLYQKGRTCGSANPADIAWDRQLAGYDDRTANPGLQPVTEVRVRPSASIQMAWGSKVGQEHGFAGSQKDQEVLTLKPGEVIVKVCAIGEGSWLLEGSCCLEFRLLSAA
jgi:hypothetical protein